MHRMHTVCAGAALNLALSCAPGEAPEVATHGEAPQASSAESPPGRDATEDAGDEPPPASAPASSSEPAFEACEAEELYLRLEGAWLDGASKLLTHDCSTPDVPRYRGPTVIYQGVLGGFQLVIAGCAADGVSEHLQLTARFDRDVSGEPVLEAERATFRPQMTSSTLLLDAQDFTQQRIPVEDWDTGHGSDPPSGKVSSGRVRLTHPSGVDAWVEFAVCHVANLRATTVR